MKKLHLLLLSLTICLFSACHNELWEAIDGLDSRVTKLEELCKEMNTNITSLQTIVSVLQSNDFITGIVEIKKNGEVIGYTITFGKHDPITIYHGQDGKDGADGKDGQNGQNGADGKDGTTPVIGVAQDTDGVYYWTLNGEWLLDDNGNKLPVSGKDGQNGTNGSNGQDGADGKDGQDGEDGKDGADGQDGKDGKDGITPQLKIEDGYWYISYDNGTTWTQLGKATGEDGKDGTDGEDGKDGQNGTDGKDGQDGDSMFQSVTQDENYVYFTLADGTVIKIAKGSGNNQSNDDFIFTITYDPNGGEGIMEKDTIHYGYEITIDTCQFFKEGYYFKEWNTDKDGKGVSYTGGRSLFAYRNIILYAQWKENRQAIDLGLSVKWAPMNVGAARPEDFGDYFAWGEVESKSSYTWNTYKWCGSGSTDYGHPSLKKYCTNYKQGSVDDRIVLEAEDDAATANWGEHWRMPTKAEWEELCDNCIWTQTKQNLVIGYLVTSKLNGNSIFLPKKYLDNEIGAYWSSSLFPSSSSFAYVLSTGSISVNNAHRYIGLSIRPIHK